MKSIASRYPGVCEISRTAARRQRRDPIDCVHRKSRRLRGRSLGAPLGKLAIDIVVDGKVPSPRTKKPERPRTRCSGLVGLTSKNQAISETKGISIPWPKVPILEQRCVKFSGRVVFLVWWSDPRPMLLPAGGTKWGNLRKFCRASVALGETELALCRPHCPMSCKVFRRTPEQSDAAAQCELVS